MYVVKPRYMLETPGIGRYLIMDIYSELPYNIENKRGVISTMSDNPSSMRSISRKRLNVTKEQLERDLFVLGLSQPQVARKYGYSVDTVRRRMREYSIEIPSYLKFVCSHSTRLLILRDVKVTPRQQSIIIGNTLGDAHIRKSNNGTGNAQISVSQRIDKKAYLEWIVEELVPFSGPVKDIPKDKACYFRTVCYREFNKFHDWFYRDGRKTVPVNLSDYLNELSLAVWYMDDGSVTSNCSTFAVGAFNDQECAILLSAVLTQFGLKGRVQKLFDSKRQKYYNTLTFRQENHKLLHRIVDPLLHLVFAYKKLRPSGSSETSTRGPLLRGVKIQSELTSDSER